MNGLLIVHLAVVAAMGVGVGLWLRKMQPGPEPMDLSWSIAIGIVGALGVALFGVWMEMYVMGDLLYYATGPVGALIALMLYNIAIAKE